MVCALDYYAVGGGGGVGLGRPGSYVVIVPSRVVLFASMLWLVVYSWWLTYYSLIIWVCRVVILCHCSDLEWYLNRGLGSLSS